MRIRCFIIVHFDVSAQSAISRLIFGEYRFAGLEYLNGKIQISCTIIIIAIEQSW
jgi:hypothetical protein